MKSRAAVILAAGQGTRMRSGVPKVLHKVGGRAMLDWSIELARNVGCERIIVVCSASGAAVQEHVEKTLGQHAIAIQDPPQGTGHAVLCAKDALGGFHGNLVVLCSDVPLTPASSVEALFKSLETGAAVSVLGFEAADPSAYGRLILGGAGNLQAIVEAKEATPEQLAVTFCNSGIMAGDADGLFKLLSSVTNDNEKGEYYLTDIVGLAVSNGSDCRTVSCTETEVMGVNSKAELARAEAAFQARKRAEFLDQGVTMVAPETVYFSHDTVVERDVEIEPHVAMNTGVTVRTGALIKAFTHLEGCTIDPGCSVGPYARLRPGAVLEEGAKIGNFVEVKNTRVGKGAKASHLSYLGDGDVGSDSNIGAGTIFCNYDGFLKHRTEIGKGAFIGSNSALVAPVRIGAGAYIGSGSTITKNVSDNALAVGRSRQVERPGWATGFRDRMAEIKASKKG